MVPSLYGFSCFFAVDNNMQLNIPGIELENHVMINGSI